MKPTLRNVLGALGVVVATSLCASFASAAEGRKTLFVHDVTVANLSESIKLQLTNLVAHTLKNAGMSYDVVTRDDIARALPEGQIGVECNDTICLAEVGRAAGVDFIAATHVAKIGTTYTVSARLIDVHLIRPANTVFHTGVGGEEVLLAATESSARELIGMEAKEASTRGEEDSVELAEGLDGGASESGGTTMTIPLLGVYERTTVASVALLGVGAAAAVTGAAFGFKFLDLRKRAMDKDEPGSQRAAYDAGPAKRNANIAWGATAAAVGAAAAVWYFLGDHGLGSDDGATAVVPIFDASMSAVALSTRF